jgi:hypothetical protein
MSGFTPIVIVIVCLQPFILVGRGECHAQATIEIGQSVDSSLNTSQRKALTMLDAVDTLSSSNYWPNIKPSLFFANVRNNILHPLKINQGKSTNFCSYAAMTHILLRYQPETYTRIILSLYNTGKAQLIKRELRPSKTVRNATGTLKNKGELDILHADQLWFLTMADCYKGYVNILDHQYDKGNENTFWAATNLSKFNRMLREYGNYKVGGVGSDLLRPFNKDMYGYITSRLDNAIVLMYINSKLMHPTRHTFFKLPAPTHFVVLYEMYKIDEMIEIKYWDYGLKTEQLITKKRLRKTIFGVSLITER